MIRLRWQRDVTAYFFRRKYVLNAISTFCLSAYERMGMITSNPRGRGFGCV
jgi:hypothetical protein